MATRESYCNTSTDLVQHLRMLAEMYDAEQVLVDASDGAMTAASATFTSTGSVFQSLGIQKYDTLIVKRGETNAGVYHVTDDATSETVLTLNRKAPASATGLAFVVTSQFREACERATLLIDDEFADLSRVVAVPFNRLLLSASLSSEDALDETIPNNQAGYLLDVSVSGASSYPVVITLTGYTEDRDWEDEPSGGETTLTEQLTFSAAGTQETSNRWTEVTKVESDWTTDGTITIRLAVPARTKHLTALLASALIAQAQYQQFSPSYAEWVTELKKEYRRQVDAYRSGLMRLAELTEGTVQRSRLTTRRMVRG